MLGTGKRIDMRTAKRRAIGLEQRGDSEQRVLHRDRQGVGSNASWLATVHGMRHYSPQPMLCLYPESYGVRSSFLPAEPRSPYRTLAK